METITDYDKQRIIIMFNSGQPLPTHCHNIKLDSIIRLHHQGLIQCNKDESLMLELTMLGKIIASKIFHSKD